MCGAYLRAKRLSCLAEENSPEVGDETRAVRHEWSIGTEDSVVYINKNSNALSADRAAIDTAASGGRMHFNWSRESEVGMRQETLPQLARNSMCH